MLGFLSAASYLVLMGVINHTCALRALKLNNLSASLLPSLHAQSGCTALQTARGKRPQVALCVYLSMLDMHAPQHAASVFVSQYVTDDISAHCQHLLCMRCYFPPLPPTLRSGRPSLQTRRRSRRSACDSDGGVQSESLHSSALHSSFDLSKFDCSV